MTLKLLVDYREHDLINLFNETEITVENLILGDIIIKNEIEPGIEDILYIIERKSISDLCSSIIDGRFREQKSRLTESITDTSKIVYIIEGSKKIIPASSKITSGTVNSSILNLLFKHNFKVIRTEDLLDTFNNIKNLYKKVENKEFDKGGGVIEVKPVKLIKKGDKLNENVFINQLGVISGVSLNIAKKIREKYSCMNDLIIAFEGGAEILKDLNITETKKIGKKLSVKIYNSLFKN